MNEVKSHTWRCDCPDAHFVTLYPLDDTGLLIVEAFEQYKSRWDRIKAAWRVLRGQRNVRCEVLLSIEVAGQMLLRLRECIDEMQKWSA